jgi:hypothetical protein
LAPLLPPPVLPLLLTGNGWKRSTRYDMNAAADTRHAMPSIASSRPVSVWLMHSILSSW